MKPTPEIEAQGSKAYERARAYETLRTWRLKASYAACLFLPVTAGIIFLYLGHPRMALAIVPFAVLSLFGLRNHSQKLEAEYSENVRLLTQLEKTYGDDLPWVQMEKHFAELRELEAEIAKEKRRT